MDTAQPVTAAETDPNAALAAAADAFKAFDKPARDDAGKFAKAEEAPEPEAEAADVEEVEDEPEEVVEPTHPKPPSWGIDADELWETLPAEAQAKIADREAERDRAVNQKFQESANARKAAEAERTTASAKATEAVGLIDTLSSLITPVKPDPRAYGAGTGQYNREAYDFAQAQYEEQVTALGSLKAQRDSITAQQTKDEAERFEAWKAGHEAEYAPRFIADVPELNDPARVGPLLSGLAEYAVRSGIPQDVFSAEEVDSITSAQLHILWKAQQFDKLRAGKAEAKPKPPAGPAIRPGVSSPRSAQRAAQHQKISERLDREGSIEAGAAMFKSFMR